MAFVKRGDKIAGLKKALAMAGQLADCGRITGAFRIPRRAPVLPRKHLRIAFDLLAITFFQIVWLGAIRK